MKMFMIIILLLVFCLGAVITVEQKTGKPLAPWSGIFGVSEEGDLVSTVKRAFGSGSGEGFSMPSFSSAPKEPEKPVTVYKWQDEEGNWHFSQEAPEDESHEALTVKAENVVDMGIDQVEIAKKKALQEYDKFRATRKEKTSEDDDKGTMESFFEGQRKSSGLP